MCGQASQAMIGVGDMYIDQEVKVKNYVQYLSKTLAVMNGVTYI